MLREYDGTGLVAAAAGLRPQILAVRDELENAGRLPRSPVEAIDRAGQAVGDGPPDPSLEIARARLAVTHAFRQSVRAVGLLFDAAGSNAIFRNYPLERYFRDNHVAVQHLSGAPGTIESAGRVMLGLEPNGPG